MRNTRSSRGFTLVELVVALGISSTLLVGMASAVMLAARMLPSRSTAAGTAADLQATMDALAVELSAAQTITKLSDSGIAFTVADRDADGRPEPITWSWGGASGEPVYRSIGSEGGRIASPRLASFSLVPTVNIETETFESGSIPGAIQRVSASDYESVATTTQWFGVQGSAWFIQEITPTWKEVTDRWEPKSVRAFLRKGSGNGSVGVILELIQLNDDGSLSDMVMGRKFLQAEDISADGWYEMPIGGQVRIAPGARLALSIRASDPSYAGVIASIQTGLASTGRSGFSASRLDKSMVGLGLNQFRFLVDGVAWTGSNAGSTKTARATSVRVTMKAEDGTSIEQVVPLLWPAEIGS